MPLKFTEPEIIPAKEIEEIVITQTVNNVESQTFTINYIIIFTDGQKRRKSLTIKGKDHIKTLYSQMDNEIATGKTFEEASKVLLYRLISPNGEVI